MEKSPLVFGLILQSSMILALGAQNLFVLEKGLLRDRSFFVAAICSVCDVTLIMLGVLGAGAFFAQNELLSIALKVAGSVFLFKYAYDKFREGGKVALESATIELKESSLTNILFSTLAVSLLNPHVYLDTVVLIGGYSTQYATTQDRLNFAIGAGLFSIIWFFSLSFGASFFSEALKKPKTMKYVNYGATAIMSCLGVSLLLSI